jgi:hypothetical protein
LLHQQSFASNTANLCSPETQLKAWPSWQQINLVIFKQHLTEHVIIFPVKGVCDLTPQIQLIYDS